MVLGEHADTEARRLDSASHVREVRAAQNDTNGGFKETGTNELAAIPTGRPPTRAQTATTPEGR
ncbi:hypothetical protein SGRIM119S_01813 [Streptomyces griseorubiginosus]